MVTHVVVEIVLLATIRLPNCQMANLWPNIRAVRIKSTHEKPVQHCQEITFKGGMAGTLSDSCLGRGLRLANSDVVFKCLDTLVGACSEVAREVNVEVVEVVPAGHFLGITTAAGAAT